MPESISHAPASVWRNPIHFLAFGFGSGAVRRAPGTWGTLAAVPFVLFRFFDILKPWPIGWVDRKLHGGLGIMLDDVLAGAMALAVLLVVEQLV